MDQKFCFFEFIEKFGHSFLLILFYSESLNYSICSYTNPTFGKNLVPERLLANQNLQFLRQLCLQIKMMKNPDFFYMFIQVHEN